MITEISFYKYLIINLLVILLKGVEKYLPGTILHVARAE